MAKTLADIREYSRWRLDQAGTDYLATSDATTFDLNQAEQEGYRKYAIATKCFPIAYSRAAVADTAVYGYGWFGAQSVDVDSVSVAAAADNTTAFTILATAPANATPISISLTGTVGEPDGNASNYTIVGTKRGMVAVSEVVSFTAAELLALSTGTLTKDTYASFESVTSITPSAAQPTGWTHSAGIPANTPGTRIFDITAVLYNDIPLDRKTRKDLDVLDNQWRTNAGGTPGWWIPWGAQVIRVYPPPTGTDDLYLEGYETPDPDSFSLDAHEPDLPEEDAYLIGLWACILATNKNPNDESRIRASIFYPEWAEGIAKAHTRIHGSGDEEVIFGKNAGLLLSDWPNISRTVENL